MAKKRSGGTPALDVATQAGIQHSVHEYTHDDGAGSFGLEAAEKLRIDPARVFKTLIATDGTSLYVGIVPVAHQLDLKAFAKATGVKALSMADVSIAERTTGYVAGGISPLGQKKRSATVIDTSGQALTTMFVSAGRRGLEIELAPADLAALTGATFAAIAR